MSIEANPSDHSQPPVDLIKHRHARIGHSGSSSLPEEMREFPVSDQLGPLAEAVTKVPNDISDLTVHTVEKPGAANDGVDVSLFQPKESSEIDTTPLKKKSVLTKVVIGAGVVGVAAVAGIAIGNNGENEVAATTSPSPASSPETPKAPTGEAEVLASLKYIDNSEMSVNGPIPERQRNALPEVLNFLIENGQLTEVERRITPSQEQLANPSTIATAVGDSLTAIANMSCDYSNLKPILNKYAPSGDTEAGKAAFSSAVDEKYGAIVSKALNNQSSLSNGTILKASAKTCYDQVIAEGYTGGGGVEEEMFRGGLDGSISHFRIEAKPTGTPNVIEKSNNVGYSVETAFTLHNPKHPEANVTTKIIILDVDKRMGENQTPVYTLTIRDK